MSKPFVFNVERWLKLKRSHKTTLIVVLCGCAILVSIINNKAKSEHPDGAVPNNLKYLFPNKKIILMWSPYYLSHEFGFNWDILQVKKCEVQNCIVTNNRYQPFHHFDAIVFHNLTKEDVQRSSVFRNSKQRYVLINQISPLYFNVFQEMNGFFNITMSYDMDSDILWSYFVFKDIRTGELIAPNKQPAWREPDDMIDKSESLKKIIQGKENKIAWFVSDCNAKNGRMGYVKELQKYIEVDIYGTCGDKVCPREMEDQCFELLRQKYYFYLAFENSNCADFVSEKVYNAMKHNTVPIVYGGANYTKFLPPNSYLNARSFHPESLAKMINRFVSNPNEYEKFFWWHSDHEIDRNNNHFCELCKVLNDKSYPHKSYQLDSIVGTQKSKCVVN